jgi:hypothetical protein
MIRTTLPTQSTIPRGMRPAEPHKRLMAAVLQAVLHDCRERDAGRPSSYAPPRTAARDVRAAIAYVASRDREWPFSFENLCEALSFDPQCLREALDIKSQIVVA